MENCIYRSFNSITVVGQQTGSTQPSIHRGSVNNPERRFRWGGTSAKHTYIFNHKNIGAIIETHILVNNSEITFFCLMKPTLICIRVVLPDDS